MNAHGSEPILFRQRSHLVERRADDFDFLVADVGDALQGRRGVLVDLIADGVELHADGVGRLGVGAAGHQRAEAARRGQLEDLTSGQFAVCHVTSPSQKGTLQGACYISTGN